MAIYNPEADGVREPSKSERYLEFLAAKLGDLDVDTLIEIVRRGDDEFIRVCRLILGANGFKAFTNDEYRALFTCLKERAWDKHLAEQRTHDALDRAMRTKRTPAEQMLDHERKVKAETPAIWH